MLDLGSQTQLSQELVNLVTQDVAPAKAKEEIAADEGKPPAQENNVVAVADGGKPSKACKSSKMKR